MSHPSKTRRWLIAARPLGRPLADSDFQADEAPLPPLSQGEVLLRTLYLSFDPAQKGFMENLAKYAEPTDIGAVMPGQGVAQVIDSKADQLAVGSIVSGSIGWREHAVMDACKLSLVPKGVTPASALGVLGMTGRTAYLGLFMVGKPKAGDTLVISGAAGAVGSVVGQLGKIAGCRVIGIAGGASKCRMLVEELGFDAAIDYKQEKLRSRLRELCPTGIDIFFDNVGGSILNDCLARLAFGARVVICGAISRYNSDPRNAEQIPPGPQNYFNVVMTNATLQGFLVHHYASHYPTADRRLAEWLGQGRLKQRDDVLDGFDNAPRALMRLFDGTNVGKQLLRVADPAPL